jgi:SAM-dependent methyltransferase
MEPAEYQTLYEQEERYWWFAGLRGLVLRQLDRFLPPERLAARGLRILDAGCGTGGMLARLDPYGRRFGIDFHPLALQLALRRETAHPSDARAALCRGSVTRLPYRDGSFDLILSLDVLYHRGVASDLAALREFRRCLRPDGLLVLNLPAFESLRSAHDAAVHTARRYRRPSLRALLCEAGFAPLRLTYWNTLLFPALAFWRILRKAARRQGAGSDVQPLPAGLNRALARLLHLERLWLERRDLPFGLSLLAVGRRTGADP